MTDTAAGAIYPALARIRDLVLAGLGLLILGPVILVLALLARLSTGASGIFVHRRLGKKGRPFKLYKLRTLDPAAPPQAQKGYSEALVTPLGRLLRTSKLDELPQLWNVIKGDMSLVGPRPIIPEEYSERSHYQRLAVKPGLTGLWQLGNHRGHPFDDNPEYDLFYMANRSFGFDLWIIWRTFLLVLTGKETEIWLVARLWERNHDWRRAAPDAFRQIPGGVKIWHLRMGAFSAFALAGLSIAVGAGLVGRSWSQRLADVLAVRLDALSSPTGQALSSAGPLPMDPIRLLLALALSWAAVLLLLPVVKATGERHSLVAQAGVFASSKKNIPYLGGLAIAGSSVASFAAVSGLPNGFGALVVCGLAVLVLGLIVDRRKQLKRRGAIWPILELGFIAWAVFLAPGVNGGLLAAAIGLGLVVVVAGAFERLDKLDGAASATAAAISGGIFLIATMGSQPAVSAFSLAVCGASFGLYRFNFKRSKISMGRQGALFVALILTTLALNLRAPFDAGSPVSAALLLLGAPLVNALVLSIVRMVQGAASDEMGSDPLSRSMIRRGARKKRLAATYAAGSLLAATWIAIALAMNAPRLMPGAVALGTLGAIAFSLSPRLVGRSRAKDQAGPAKPPKSAPLLNPVARRVMLGVGIALAASMAMAVPPALGARSNLLGAHQSLQQGASEASALNFGAAQASLARADALARAAEADLRSGLTRPARLMPVIRSNIQSAQTLASAVTLLTPALRDALKASEAFTGADGRLSFDKGRLDLRPLEEMVQPLQRAAGAANLAVGQVGETKGLLLKPVADARSRFIREGYEVTKTIGNLALVTELLPKILGGEGPRTYFLMIQNETEQRGTGGLLGAFGILHADKGQLKLERLESNLSLPPGARAPSPSGEFAARYDRFGSRSSWANVNMTPDFPTAAHLITQMWESKTSNEVDGVMSIDGFGLAKLLEITGPINPPEFGVPLTSKNFVRMTLNEAYVRFPAKAERVDFLLPVGRQIWTKFLGASDLNPRQLTEAFGRSFSSKHMQFWSQQEADELKRLGIDGALKDPNRADYLLVVGQNAGGNKIDYYGRRRIDYQVDVQDDGRVKGKARVLLRNDSPSKGLPRYIIGPFGPRDSAGLNRSYLSLYLPGNAGAQTALVNGKPVALESHAERGLAVISRFLEVPAGKSARLDLELSGHRLDTPGEYRLIVQHQPGIHPDELNLSVGVPDGMAITTMSPGMRRIGGRAVWQGKLTSDREFIVRYG